MDPVSGVWTPNAALAVYAGPGRIRSMTTTEQEVLFGAEEVMKLRFVATVPWDCPELDVDDVVTVTASTDPHIANRSFRITAILGGSNLIDRRVATEETT